MWGDWCLSPTFGEEAQVTKPGTKEMGCPSELDKWN